MRASHSRLSSGLSGKIHHPVTRISIAEATAMSRSRSEITPTVTRNWSAPFGNAEALSEHAERRTIVLKHLAA